jgi:hypothetical protein
MVSDRDFASRFASGGDIFTAKKDARPASFLASAHDHFVAAHQTQNVARLFIQKIEVKEIVGKSVGFVAHFGDLNLQPGTLAFKFGGLCVDLDALEEAIITPDAGEGEVGAKGKDNGKINHHAVGWVFSGTAHHHAFAHASGGHLKTLLHNKGAV